MIIEHFLRIKSFGKYKVNVGGGRHIVNANEDRGGASMRLLVEFDGSPSVWFIYPGGQSGNVGSFYYDNLVAEWEKGKYLQFFMDRVDQNVSLTFNPVKD